MCQCRSQESWHCHCYGVDRYGVDRYGVDINLHHDFIVGWFNFRETALLHEIQ